MTAMVMTLDIARELLNIQISMASGFNRNSAKLILAEIMRVHGQMAAAQLIPEMGLESKFDFKPGENLFV